MTLVPQNLTDVLPLGISNDDKINITTSMQSLYRKKDKNLISQKPDYKISWDQQVKNKWQSGLAG